MTKRDIITRELAAMALSTIEIDDTDSLGAESPSLSEPVPSPLAQQFCARLARAGIDADWAPDGDDGSLAWVYVGTSPADLDTEVNQ